MYYVDGVGSVRNDFNKKFENFCTVGLENENEFLCNGVRNATAVRMFHQVKIFHLTTCDCFSSFEVGAAF